MTFSRLIITITRSPLYHAIISVLASLFFLGCASNQVSSSKPPNGDELSNSAQQKIQEFNNADPKIVLLPYVLLVSEISNIENDAETCLAKNVAIYKKMYALNSSSLIANSMLSACQIGTPAEVENYLVTYISVIENLLKNNDGSTVEKAVQIREYSEAELILTAGEYSVLDYEIIDRGKEFYYRLHAIDDRTGEFEYHYYKNFEFMKKLYSAITDFNSAEELRKFIIGIFVKTKNPAAINYVSNLHLSKGEYKKAIDVLSKLPQLTPISRINLARAYLYSQQDNKIDNLLDDLIIQKDSGDINAAIFIIELLEKLNGLQSAESDINALIAEIDKRTSKGHANFLLAELYHKLGNEKLFKYWQKRAIKDNPTKNYRKIIRSLRGAGDIDGYIAFLRKQHQSGNTEASYDLAYEYYKGRYLDKDNKKENELYLHAAKKGHVKSMYELAENLEKGIGAKLDAKQALYWFKEAAKKGYVSAFNEIGHIYYMGTGDVDVDYQAARKWMEKGSDAGKAISTTNLGLFYENGRGVEIDFDKASYYYELGAKNGFLKGYERLGDLYQYVDGYKNLEKAAQAYYQGATNGHTRSQYEYAMINARHLNHESKALKWFELVFESNDHKAITWSANNLSNGLKYLSKDIKRANRFYEKASDLGNKNAQTSLGFHYETGDGVVKNKMTALAYYQKSAAQGDAQGLNNLATFYLRGYGGLKVDKKKAFELYSKASSLGNDFAHNNLAEMYFEGDYVKEDLVKAQELFLKAAKLKFKASYFYLGYLYLSGAGGVKDYQKARFYLEESIANGNLDSAENLAVMYSNGYGVEQDFNKAAELFRLSAMSTKDTVNIHSKVGDYFYFGIYGTQKNYTVAMKHYKKASSENAENAMNNIGEMYRHGQGVDVDYKAALKWYRKAVKLNSSVAMYNLSEFYRNGLGVSKDKKQEIHWMEQSANGGFHDAFFQLSNLLFESQNFPNALLWLNKAVDVELPEAMYKMARLKYLGHYVSIDVEGAKKLMQKAAEKGNKKAKKAIENNFKDII